MLHTMSVNFPLQPNLEAAIACEKFITSLPWLIPCDHCGHDFHDFIRLNVAHNGSKGTMGGALDCGGNDTVDENQCLSPWEACRRGRSSVVSFLVRAHNNVNDHTHPCRERWTTADAMSVYAQRGGVCLNNIVWGTCTIPRDDPDANGVGSAEYFLALGLQSPTGVEPCDETGGVNHTAHCCNETSHSIPLTD